jgi:DNA-binding NarL/FixJ family response regulator
VKLCRLEGCDKPVAPTRRSFCGPEHAKQVGMADQRAWHRANLERSPRLRLDDIDPVSVEIAMQGQRVALNLGERRFVVAELTERGLGSAEIAQLLHTTRRTVVRDRAALRKETP